ncbi:carbohydrate ABC transporter permease [Cohnella abietis]|uniref:ABC transporter permease n=1 Tax=Cohnella abietis TaxID=2507935 RepID=A0A3T1D1N3_9BACL|nr:sugar ABC transporter permease [Cohnella abietis]BBI31961.1 ABC transporter permease [Cohnella abietis]
MGVLSFRTQKLIILCSFLILPLLLLGVFTYYPAFTLIRISFTDWNGISLHKMGIGWENYTRIFSDSKYLGIFNHNLIYFLVGFIQIGLSLYFAVILNSKLRGKNIFRAIIFSPYIINSVAIAFMFTFLLNSEVGALNVVLKETGLHFLAKNWLSDPQIINYTLAFMATWKYLGFMMVIILGALQSIPNDLYEAASIDGANGFQSFRFITLPSLRRILELCFFLNLNGALAAFEFPFVIFPSGSPLGMSDTFVTNTLLTSFRYSDFGLASAMGVLLMIITIILVLTQRLVFFGRDEK